MFTNLLDDCAQTQTTALKIFFTNRDKSSLAKILTRAEILQIP